MNAKKKIYLSICMIALISNIILCSGQQIKTEQINYHSASNDTIQWDNEQYSCLMSPLIFFKDYTTVFPPCSSSTINETGSIVIIYDEKSYRPVWKIKDGRLYLCKINPICLDKDDNGNARIEKLTGKKFEHDTSNSEGIGEEYMFASWFSDSLYIRRYQHYGEDPEQFAKTAIPYLIIFNKGRIVSIKQSHKIPADKYFEVIGGSAMSADRKLRFLKNIREADKREKETFGL